MEIVDIASEYSKAVLSGEERRISVYEQRSKVKLKELIEIGSSGMPPTNKGGEDFLAVLSNNIKSSNYEKLIINSLDFFLSQYSQDEVIRTIHAAKISNLENSCFYFILLQERKMIRYLPLEFNIIPVCNIKIFIDSKLKP